MQKWIFLLLVLIGSGASSQSTFQFAVLKYSGGGDWYSNPTSIPNLVEYCNKNLSMNINKEVATVEVGSAELYNYPFIHMTGHGNVVFSAAEAENLKNYLLGGGFLHISDNYGMDQFIRSELKKVFPDNNLEELSSSHPIYHQKYDFPNGLPKIHEHDGKGAKGYGIVIEGRVVIYYDFECDLGDGWEDPAVHKDSEEIRTKALKMGANLVQYALMGTDE